MTLQPVITRAMNSNLTYVVRTSFFPLLKNHMLPNDGIVFAKEQLVRQLAGILAGEIHETRVGRRHELDKDGFQLAMSIRQRNQIMHVMSETELVPNHPTNHIFDRQESGIIPLP